jgi:5'-AMP-activated protein kinase catalytic alpha subunit
MVCGYLPFDDPNTAELYRKIAEGNYELPDHISNNLRSLFKIILNVNPSKRATIKEIREHPFCQQNPVPVVDGIIVGVSCIPIESSIVGALQRLRVDVTGLQDYIRNNRHNSLSASYYLLLEKKLAESGSNIL